MAELITPAQVDAELADTADYDVTADVDKAKRRVAALRRKLDFPSMSGRNTVTMQHEQIRTENQLKAALAFIQGSSTSEAQRLADPAVLHADFSTFRGYSP